MFYNIRRYSIWITLMFCAGVGATYILLTKVLLAAIGLFTWMLSF